MTCFRLLALSLVFQLFILTACIARAIATQKHYIDPRIHTTEPGDIYGFVLDVDGRPINSARPFKILIEGQSWPTPLSGVTKHDNGFFNFQSLPPDADYLVTMYDRFGIRAATQAVHLSSASHTCVVFNVGASRVVNPRSPCCPSYRSTQQHMDNPMAFQNVPGQIFGSILDSNGQQLNASEVITVKLRSDALSRPIESTLKPAESGFIFRDLRPYYNYEIEVFLDDCRCALMKRVYLASGSETMVVFNIGTKATVK